jgi:DNA-binding response OmpR family regulator
MPFINGLDVAKAVRTTNKDIPIIMLTAHSEQEILLRAIDLKLEKYLLKPIDDKSLIQIVQKVISEIQDKDIIPLKEKLLWNKTNSNLFYEEKSIKLTKKEHKLIALLIKHIGEYFTHDTLIIQIWDDEMPDASHDNKLHQLVYRLNKKINSVTKSNTPLIENSYTLGYRVQV